MEILLIFIGLLIGLAAGFAFSIQVYSRMDERAVTDGVIKLCGRYFRLTEIEL